MSSSSSTSSSSGSMQEWTTTTGVFYPVIGGRLVNGHNLIFKNRATCIEISRKRCYEFRHGSFLKCPSITFSCLKFFGMTNLHGRSCRNCDKRNEKLIIRIRPWHFQKKFWVSVKRQFLPENNESTLFSSTKWFCSVFNLGKLWYCKKRRGLKIRFVTLDGISLESNRPKPFKN